LSETDRINEALDRSLLCRLGRDPYLQLVAALSGGLDSVVLVHALQRWLRNQDLFQPGRTLPLEAFHVRHNLRSADEGDADESVVRSLCESLDIPLKIESVPPGRIEAENQLTRQGIEAAARDVRYRLMKAHKTQREAEGCSVLFLTAHHRDDQMETLVMRFFQGAGVFGMAGIPEHRPGILRPLLDISRRELESYAEYHHLSWAEDSSNQDTRYLRNQIRHQLLPVVQKIFPGGDAALSSLARDRRDLTEFLEAHILKPGSDEQGPYLLWDFWRKETPWGARAALYHLFNASSLPVPHRIPSALIAEMAAQLNSAVEGWSMEVPGGSLFLSDGKIRLGNHLASSEEKGYLIGVSLGRAVEELYSYGLAVAVCEEGEGEITWGEDLSEGFQLSIQARSPFFIRSPLRGDSLGGRRGDPRGTVCLVDGNGMVVASLGLSGMKRYASVFQRDETPETKKYTIYVKMRTYAGSEGQKI